MNNLFAVYDTCAGIFGDPFVAINDVVAKRTFEFSISNPSIPKYVRDDAVLYSIGHYDAESGYVTNDVPPYIVCRGSTVVVPGVSPEPSATPPETFSDSEVKNNEE